MERKREIQEILWANLGTNSQDQAVTLAGALQSSGIRADIVALEDSNHFAANEGIGEPGDVTTMAVEKFLLSLTGEKPGPARN